MLMLLPFQTAQTDSSLLVSLGAKSPMKNFLALVGGLVLILAGVGWYKGWYSINRQQQNGQSGLTIAIDTGKIKEDLADGKEKLRDLFKGETKPGQEEAEPKASEIMGPPEPLIGPPAPPAQPEGPFWYPYKR